MFREVLLFFLSWRLFLFAITFFGSTIIPLIPNGAHFSFGSEEGFSYIHSWAQWDGGHYISIGEEGYTDRIQYAFFPFFPLLIGIFKNVFQNTFLAAFLVSNTAALFSLLFLAKLLRIDYNWKITRRVIFYFLIFPTSFFLVATYSEALFFVFVFSSLYFSRRGNWLAACLLCAFSSATRLVGVFLVPALLFEYFHQKNFDPKRVKSDILFFLVSPLGLVFYMFFLWLRLGDPLFFLKIEQFWQRSIGFSFDSLSPSFLAIFNFSNLGSASFSYDFFNVFFAVLAFVLSLVAIFIIRPSYGIFATLAIVIPVLSGTFVSTPRYALASFVIFILFALWERRNTNLFTFVRLVSLGFLTFFSILFINGYWVA